MEEEKDLFDHYEELPDAVKEVLCSFDEDVPNRPMELQRLQSELNKLGYDFEYDFNEAWGLHKM